MKRGYYRDPRLGGGWFRDAIERAVREGKARVVWTPESGWTDGGKDDDETALHRWHDDGGC